MDASLVAPAWRAIRNTTERGAIRRMLEQFPLAVAPSLPFCGTLLKMAYRNDGKAELNENRSNIERIAP